MAEDVTTSLNIDITQFKKALTDANRYIRMANSEFENATAGTEKWANSADGLRAKIGQLEKTLDAQEAAAAALRLEYEKVAKEEGESSKGAQELAIKLNKQEAACKKTAAQIKKYQGDLDEMEAAANDAGDEAKEMGNKVDNAASSTKKAAKNAGENEKATAGMSGAFGKAATAAGTLAKGLAKITGKTIIAGIKGIAAASAGLVTAFLASGEASKEYITSMGKLETAFTQSGHSAETAQEAYTELVGVLGDTDKSVEAASHLAKLTDSEEELAKWTGDILPGVFATFGDSLPVEGLAETANETAKTGKITGVLADAINWATTDSAAWSAALSGNSKALAAFNKSTAEGESAEDAFNAALAVCSTEQERQALITETLTSLYGDAAAAYKETNAEIIRSNQANEAWTKSMAGVGQAALPITSTLKLMGAAILDDLLPNVQTLGTAFNEALNGSETAATKMGDAVGSILQQLGGKIMAALPTIITVGTSIITSLIQGLVQAVPQLAEGVTQIVQYFIQAAPELLQAGVAMVSSLVGAIKQSLPQLLAMGGEMLEQLLSGLVSNLPAMAQGAMNAIGGFVQGIQTYLPIILSKGAELLGKLGEGLRTALPDLISQGLDILMNLATSLYDAAPMIIDIGFDLISNLVSGLLSALPTLIEKGPEIISKFANIINDNVPKLLSRGAELIWQIIKGLVSAIPALVKNIPKIIQAIVDVWQAFNWLNLGKSAITALKNGITSMGAGLKTAGKKILDSISNSLQSLPGKLLNLGKSAISGMGNGISSMIRAVRAAGGNVLTAVVNAIRAMPSKLLAYGQQAMTSLGNALQNGISTLKSKATNIVTNVVNVIKTLPSKVVSIGSNMVKGIWEGMSKSLSWIKSKITGWVGDVMKFIKKLFGIESPSKVMRDQVGKWLPAGMAEGIEGNTKATTKAMANMAKDALSAANTELSGGSLDVPGVNAGGGQAGAGKAGATYNFYQYNTSPKALSRKDIYRQTKNALKFATSTT